MDTIHLDPWVVAFVAGTLIPILTGIATKLTATPGTKAVVSFVLSAAIAVANQIVVADGELVTRETLLLFATTFATQAAVYQGWWKPVGGGAAPLARETEHFGIS